jgi:hypothetical protein
MRQLTEKDLFIYANVVICGELMCNYMEELKDTKVYRQSLKNSCNNAQNEIELMLNKELPKMYQVDELFLTNIMNNFKSLVEDVTSCGPDDLLIISQLIQSYKKDKDKFLDKFEITLTKIDE